jgi:gliding motility-associated-like protein
MFVPNAFTPNADGLNDLFPAHRFVSEGGFYEFKVFNRWGEKLWQSNNPLENWDGTVHGKLVPEGIYVYLVNWVGCDNFRRTASGNISVMR